MNLLSLIKISMISQNTQNFHYRLKRFANRNQLYVYACHLGVLPLSRLVLHYIDGNLD